MSAHPYALPFTKTWTRTPSPHTHAIMPHPAVHVFHPPSWLRKVLLFAALFSMDGVKRSTASFCRLSGRIYDVVRPAVLAMTTDRVSCLCAAALTNFVHHGMIYVPPGYSFGPQMFGTETAQVRQRLLSASVVLGTLN